MIAKPKELSDELSGLWDEYQEQVHVRIGSAGMEALCSAVLRLRRARARINDEGEIVSDPKGNPVPHPALAVEKTASAEVRAWVSKFGIKPVAAAAG